MNTTPKGTSSAARDRLVHLASYARAHPDRILPYLRRLGRNLRLGLSRRDHVSFYRAVMSRNVAADADLAVGSGSRERWLELGEAQFEYLVASGLRPDHRLLEIGCGNLRAGWRFIDYLDVGNYTGIDISPDVLLAAQRTMVEFDLTAKQPRLTPISDLRLLWLPANHYDVVHAHSVFSHCPLDVIEECLAHVARVMAPGGFFDFTFNATTGQEHQVLREDYYYRPEHLIELAAEHGFSAELCEDWSANRQDKLRLRPG